MWVYFWYWNWCGSGYLVQFLQFFYSGSSFGNPFFSRFIDFFPRVFLFMKGQTPESGIPPSSSATRRYTKVHLGCCLRFSTPISQIGRLLLFGAGPRGYIRSRPFRLAVTAFWRAFSASWRSKGKRKQIFPRAVRTTELPSNPSPLTFRNNQILILQTSSTHTTMAANVFQQDTNTHGTQLSHARSRQSFSTPHIKNGQNGKLTGARWLQDDLEESGKVGGGL